MPNKDREIKAMAEVLMILTKEVVENPTFAIKDSFRYVHREVVTDTLASEAAYCDFLERTGLDIRKYDWYGGKVKTKDGETISINQLYTTEDRQVHSIIFSIVCLTFGCVCGIMPMLNILGHRRQCTVVP